MDVTIREIALDDGAGHEAYAAVWNTLVPRDPVTAEEVVEHRVRRRGADRRFLARVNWQIAGCALAVRSDLPGRTFARIAVLEPSRRNGIGTAFLELAIEEARAQDSEILSSAVEEGDEAGEAFAARFGFVERLREVEVIAPPRR